MFPLESSTSNDIQLSITSQGFLIVLLYVGFLFTFVLINESLHFWNWLRSGRQPREITEESSFKNQIEEDITSESESQGSESKFEEGEESEITDTDEESEITETSGEEYESDPCFTLKRRRRLKSSRQSKRRHIVPISV